MKTRKEKEALWEAYQNMPWEKKNVAARILVASMTGYFIVETNDHETNFFWSEFEKQIKA